MLREDDDTLQSEHLVPGAVSGTKVKTRSVSRSLGEEVPLNAMMSSWLEASSNRTPWVSVASLEKYLITLLPKGGESQVSPYAAAEKAV